MLFDIYYSINSIEQRPDINKEFSNSNELKSYYDNIGATLINVSQVLYHNFIEYTKYPKIENKSNSYVVTNDLRQFRIIRLIGAKRNISPNTIEAFILENFKVYNKKIKNLRIK